MNADEHRWIYLLTYAVSTALYEVALYLVLHAWLHLGFLWVGGAMLATVVLLTATFVTVFVTARLPTPEERLVARLKFVFRLNMTVLIATAAGLCWIIHARGGRGWLQSVAIFVCATLFGGYLARAAHGNGLRRELRKLRERQARRQSPHQGRGVT